MVAVGGWRGNPRPTYTVKYVLIWGLMSSCTQSQAAWMLVRFEVLEIPALGGFVGVN